MTDNRTFQKRPAGRLRALGRFHGSTLTLAVSGSGLMWLPQPPLAWWPLAWIAPIPWLLLVRKNQLLGRRPYVWVGLAGWLFWLLAIHWIRLPHPANYLAWPVLAAVLGAYLPLFMALARVGVHRFRWPLWLVAPVVWTGTEWLRAHLLSGFYMGSLAQTQIAWLPIIQLSDLTGEYGVTFLIVLVAACLTQAWPAAEQPGALRAGWRKQSLLALLPAGFALALALGYGHLRLERWSMATESAAARPAGPRIALIQGYSPADWKSDAARQRHIMEQYVQLSHEAVARAGVARAAVGQNVAASSTAATIAQHHSSRPIDLIVWPETMFRQPLLSVATDFKPPPGSPLARLIGTGVLSAGPRELAALVRQLGTAVLVGIDRHVAMAGGGRVEKAPGEAGEPAIEYESFNSAVLVDRQGNIVGTYDKMHRVMFGEYIPMADWFPILYRWTPLTGGIRPGRHPAGLELDGVVYAPSICYETVLPHVLRNQVVQLARQGKKPDVLVNLTNDAWFWGSSELDMHLACGVLRAVEMRLPLVIAANGGLSASIDARGNVCQVSGRLQEEVLLADVEIGNHGSLYLWAGDWFAGGCVVCCTVLALAGWRGRVESLEKS